jgi:hypothetical protein
MTIPQEKERHTTDAGAITQFTFDKSLLRRKKQLWHVLASLIQGKL